MGHWRFFCHRKESHQKLARAEALELLEGSQGLPTIQTADKIPKLKNIDFGVCFSNPRIPPRIPVF